MEHKRLDMDRQIVVVSALVFLAAVVTGFALGSPEEKAASTYREDVSYTANASNPIEEVRFDDRNISLMVQSGEKAQFFIEADNEVEPIQGLKHDGNINEYSDFITLEEDMYLLNFRYRDDSEASEDEWITLYRITKL